MSEVCRWFNVDTIDGTDIWRTDCCNTFCVDNGLGPLDNGFCYCPYCGKELEEQELNNAIE